MNELKKFFDANKEKDLNKWYHYFDIYDENLKKYKSKKITLLEIGVFRGGSLKMWKNYFKTGSSIIGIDINSECKKYANDKVKIFIGNQTNQKFLDEVLKKISQPDIIIDDGGHTANQQIFSFNYLYPYLKNGGTYIVEDTHTSYHSTFQDRPDGLSFMDYAKSLPDKLNLWYQYNDYRIYDTKFRKKINKNEINKVPYFTKNTYKISFYNSMVVFEKRLSEEPKSEIK